MAVSQVVWTAKQAEGMGWRSFAEYRRARLDMAEVWAMAAQLAKCYPDHTFRVAIGTSKVTVWGQVGAYA